MPLFRKAQVLTIYDCVSVENCKLIHRITSGQCAKPISNFYMTTNRQINHQTRNSNITIMKHTAATVNKSFLCKSVKDWGLLSTNCKLITNLKCFSKCLKKRFLDKY